MFGENTDSIILEFREEISPSLYKGLDRMEAQTASIWKNLKGINSALGGAGMRGRGAGASVGTRVGGGASAAVPSRAPTSDAGAARATTQAAIGEQRLAAAVARRTAAEAASARATTQSEIALSRKAIAEQNLTRATATAARATTQAELATLRLTRARQDLVDKNRQLANGEADFIKKLAGGVAFGLAAREVLRLADSYTTLQNKLQNVATSEGQIENLTTRLFNLANESRSSVDATATAFTRFDRALKSMGKGQDDTLRMTETVNKALVNSGATAQEAASALLQLSQGFNAGRLQGDEFRSVSENMPIVLDHVAKVMGVTTGAVKELSSQGKITAEVLYSAFTSMRETVDNTFARTVPTISQSFTVLENKSTAFIGRLDKMFGITRNLSKAMLALSDNIELVAIGATAAGGAMAAAYGPQIVAAISKVTTGLRAMAVAAASNPIIAIAALATTAAVALAAYSDQITITDRALRSASDSQEVFAEQFPNLSREMEKTGGSVVTLADGITGAFETAKTFIASAADTISNDMNKALSYVGGLFGDFEIDVKGVLSAVGSAVKWFTNTYIRMHVNAYNVVRKVISEIPNIAKWAYSGLYNVVARSLNGISDLWNWHIETIVGGVKKTLDVMLSAVPARFRGSIQKSLDEVEKLLTGFSTGKLELKPEVDLDLKRIAKEIGDEYNLLKNRDFVGEFVNSWQTETLKAAEKRLGELRKGTDEVSRAAASGKSALADYNAELEREIELARVLLPLRENIQKLDEMRSKSGAAVDDARVWALLDRLRAEKAVSAEMDRLYTETHGPMLQFKATQEAINELLKQGTINRWQYNVAQAKAKEDYLSAVNPMRDLRRGLDDEIKLLRVAKTERESASKMMQIANDLRAKGIDIYAKENATIRAGFEDRVRLIDTLTAREAALELERARKAELREYSAELRDGGFSQDISRNEQEHFRMIEEMRSDDLISWEEYHAARFNIFRVNQNKTLDRSKLFFNELEGLSKTGNEEMARIAKAAAITNATINTYQSATAAYAAMASIPVVGPALGATAAAAAIAAGIANIAEIQKQQTSGFYSGGYTGDGPRTQVAGVTHRREFVLNANATQRIGRERLERMNRGSERPFQQVDTEYYGSRGNGSYGAAGAAGNVTIANVLDPGVLDDWAQSPAGEKRIVNIMTKNAKILKQWQN